MRRISLLLGFAVLALAAFVGYTYSLRLHSTKTRLEDIAPQIEKGYEALANGGWTYDKSDPNTNKRIVHVTAKSFQATADPSTFELHEVALRLYKNGGSYTFVRSGTATFDERTGVMKSKGPVFIVMNVPSDKNAEIKAEIAKLLQVETAGVRYETKTGKADTDQPASFHFAEGGGKAVGVSYDPNTGDLHLKSSIALDWLGKGSAENKMHVEAGDAVYKEREQKVYLSPWSRLKRRTTTIDAKSSLIILQDGYLHQIDSDKAVGKDVREDKQTGYSADKMTALFDENGALVNIVGVGDAKVVTTEPASRTTMTGNRADLRFAVETKPVDGLLQSESNLHLVLADGHATAQSEPLPQPGVQLAETRILRSEHLELEMKPDGKDVQEIRTPSQAQLEFKPNRPDQPHRTLDASRLRIVYGEGSYIESFVAWNAATHTDKPQAAEKAIENKPKKPSPPALTWSDQLIAKFTPDSNQVDTIEQTGHFRYQEGGRKADAKKAFLEQGINRITLFGNAHVSDDTGSTAADKIVMNQTNGDMDAIGRVISAHAPDKNEKPGTSMLDRTKTMQAKADQMQTRDNNATIFYEGRAVMWQGANRIAANLLMIDRDEQTLKAYGQVVSELVDTSSDSDPGPGGSAGQPVFTVVYAPELLYQDDTRVANYTGGVKLERNSMTVTANKLEAFLTPRSDNSNDDSSLDHAYADGDVKIFHLLASGRTRTGTSDHCEYYTKDDKVVLNGGAPQMIDSYKGVTKGRQLTYFSGDDRLVVEGAKKVLAYTQMKKR